MGATVRSCKATPLHGSGAASRGDVQPGDLLLAFHSADGGSISEMSLSGWEPLASLTGGTWAGTELWQRTATVDEPTTYPVAQRGTADGVVTIVAIRSGQDHGIIVVPGYSGTTAPSAAPNSASGLELRYAAGLTQAGGAVSWSVPSGYTEQADAQATIWTSAVLASKSLISSVPVPEVTLDPSVGLYVSHTLTVIVASSATSGSGGPPPTAPEFPAFTPAKGSGRWRYTAHDLLTGQYIDDLYDPTGVYFDRRIGEPGTFSATLTITNPQVAGQVATIVPRTPDDLTTGPGKVLIHVWRNGGLWGMYWLTGHQTTRTRGQKPTVTLRGSTLDAYPMVVAVEEELLLDGGDQVQNARDLLAHMQSDPHSNLGLALKSGLSGVDRPLQVSADADTTYGKVLADYAKVSDGFEYVVNPTVVSGTIQRRWVWGSPKLGGDQVHTFQEGEEGGDILDWGVTVDVMQGGTRTRVRGGTPPADDVTQDSGPVTTAWVDSAPHFAAGWPKISKTINHPSASTELSVLEVYGARWMEAAAGAVWVRSATVALGAAPSIHPNLLGDKARLVMTNEWHPRGFGKASYDISERIIGLGIRPGAAIDEAEIILESSLGGA